MTNYFPSKFPIIGITNAQYAVVTFPENHEFLPNSIISLRVSKQFGMVEINNLQVKVLSATPDTVTLDIDSSNFTPFVVPADPIIIIPPYAVPSASGVDLLSPVPRTILEDAFDHRPN